MWIKQQPREFNACAQAHKGQILRQTLAWGSNAHLNSDWGLFETHSFWTSGQSMLCNNTSSVGGAGNRKRTTRTISVRTATTTLNVITLNAKFSHHHVTHLSSHGASKSRPKSWYYQTWHKPYSGIKFERGSNGNLFSVLKAISLKSSPRPSTQAPGERDASLSPGAWIEGRGDDWNFRLKSDWRFTARNITIQSRIG